ncbi:MAG: Zn-dependent protease with chaperone function [Candidatus Electronema aureum]|uniref:Zn-dependent protease with chaperone function n=1 Tax=Candidatus Electronema aureum TaxID=2005002 RepID=A0A521G1R9_9BACT|nr:MAG: Zn-dependent protease with chaperone function [Candidatus Electronema aureum]
MTDQHFAAIVSKSEELAKTRPAYYQRKLWLLAVLGNLYLAAVLLTMIALQAVLLFVIVQEVMATGRIGWQVVFCIAALILTIWAVLEPVLVKKDKLKPEPGILLTRKQAPELFALTDALCRQINAPRVRRVVITDKFNAGVEQLPRLGIFGWYKSNLVLGLPLLKCMTVEQFKAVLAHELGHLARGHGKTKHRIHQQQLRWTELAEILSADLRGFLFSPFLKWFVPYFAACSFPLARMNEYEADAASVRLVSKGAAVEALSASNVIDKYLQEHYWPQVHQLADQQPEPVAPYLAMGRNLAAEVDAAWAMHWVAEDMKIQTGPTASHPALQDRLKALQATPRLVLPAAGENAEGLLGSALQAVTEQMDREWQDKNRAWWVERYQRGQNNRRQFAELNARVASGAELTVEEAYQRAQLTWSVGRNEEETLRQLLALYQRAAQHPLASFGLGAWLLNRGAAEDGQVLLEQTMRLDEGFTARCCEMLRDYCWRNGREEEAHGWHEKIEAHCV